MLVTCGSGESLIPFASQIDKPKGEIERDDTTSIEFAGRDAVTDPLTDLLRKEARELLQAAVEAGRDAFLVQFCDQRTPDGHAAVVRNGHHPERAVQTGIGLLIFVEK